MPTTLNNGIQLPDKGSVDWYSSMQSNYNLIDTHLGNTDIHVTAEDKANWDSKQGSLSQDQLDAIAQVAINTDDIATLQSDKADASHTHSSSDITDIGDYATKQYVDTSISGLVDNAPDALNTLNELSAALNDDSNFASTVTTALGAKANSADLATVAISGSYTDLTDKPTINDSTITIQKNGSTVDTFTTNGSAKTINIPVPTKTSDLTNDSNFVDTSNSAVSSGITPAKVTDYDTHIADTDIHVTSSDKTTWNTVTSKANDSDVVHKSGDETISGTKTFGNGTLIVNNGIGNNVHGEIKFNGSRTGYIVADNAADGVFDNSNCGISILLQDAGKPLHIAGYKVDSNGRVFADNTNKNPVLSITSNLVKTVTLVPENDSVSSAFKILSQLDYANGNTSKLLDVRFVQYDDANATSAIYSNDDNKTTLGISSRKWRGVYATNYYYGSNNVEFSTKFVTTDTAQTITGQKVFSATPYIYNIDSTGNTPSIFFRNSKVTKGGSDTGNQSIFFTDKDNKTLSKVFTDNSSNGTTSLNLRVGTLDNNDADVSAEVDLFVAKNGTKVLQASADNDIYLGRTTNRWKDTCTCLINGLEPSSLSLPSGNSSDFIDISSYFSNTDNTNSYVAPANGWIYLRLGDISSCQATVHDSNNNRMWGQSTAGSVEQITIPILKGLTLTTQWATSSAVTVATARFIPCQGNV